MAKNIVINSIQSLYNMQTFPSKYSFKKKILSFNTHILYFSFNIFVSKYMYVRSKRGKESNEYFTETAYEENI